MSELIVGYLISVHYCRVYLLRGTGVGKEGRERVERVVGRREERKDKSTTS